MKHLIRNALVAVLGAGVAGLVGCEWSGGGEDNSWNDTGNLANFNGSYQGTSGYLVSEYTATPVSSDGSSSDVNVLDENKGTTPGGMSFGGRSSLAPIKAGSFRLLLDGGSKGVFTDDGSGQLTGWYINGTTFNTTGTISYDNGTYGVVANGVPFAAGQTITINYTITTGSGGSTSSSASPGSSGVSIYAFNVQQTGNKLKIIDNNGSVYEGSLGDSRTTGNLGSSSTEAEFVNGDQVIASFSASGMSAANVHVNMTGTFQGTAAGVSKVTTKSGDSVTYTISMALSDRRIMGTWVEEGGKTGNINGISPSAVNVTYAGNTSTNAVP